MGRAAPIAQGRIRRAALALAIVAPLVATGCGGDDDLGPLADPCTLLSSDDIRSVTDVELTPSLVQDSQSNDQAICVWLVPSDGGSDDPAPVDEAPSVTVLVGYDDFGRRRDNTRDERGLEIEDASVDGADKAFIASGQGVLGLEHGPHYVEVKVKDTPIDDQTLIGLGAAAVQQLEADGQ
jgi:hypothetical protein